MNRFSRTIPLAGAATALACVGRPAVAQTPVHWSAFARAAATPGAAPGTAVVRVTAGIDRGWHIYSLTQAPGGPAPTRISLPAGAGYVGAAPIRTTRPRVAFDSAFGMTVELHERRAVFDVPVRRVRAATPGAGAEAGNGAPIRLAVRYQACNDRLCLPPQTAHLSAVPPRARRPGA